MAVITEQYGYKFADIVLSMRTPFTIDEILKELEIKGIRQSKLEVRRSLDKLKDSGVIIQYGSQYTNYLR